MSDLHTPIDPRRAHHDMGGLSAAAIEATEHDYALWEKRIDAILTLLSNKGLMTVDEMRKNIESLGPDAYDQMSYYERWISCRRADDDPARRRHCRRTRTQDR